MVGTRTKFQPGLIDFWSILVAFQLDAESQLIRHAPTTTTTDQEGRLCIAARAFMYEIVASASRDMPKETETARSGLFNAAYDTDRTYTVMRSDFDAW